MPDSDHPRAAIAWRAVIAIAVAFLLVRALTTLMYEGVYYYYGMVAGQFAIADAAYHGHWFAQDEMLVSSVNNRASEERVGIPIERWRSFPRSNVYTTFPAHDLPGFGYLIACTSKLFSRSLTSRYAFGLQVGVELLSLLAFLLCVSIVFGRRVAIVAGIIYVIGYPFVWPMASQPMRDIFVMGVYAFYLLAFFIFLRHRGALALLAIMALLLVSVALLWVRPSAYYFFFLVAPLALLARNRSLASRLSFFVLTVLVASTLFGLQLRAFNMRHYGVADTDFLGRGLWAGMGQGGDSPYGFAYDDLALVPWAKQHGYDVQFSSPRMNQVLGAYARKVIRDDPAFYARTVLARAKLVALHPLVVEPPPVLSGVGFNESGLSLIQYAGRYPARTAALALGVLYGLAFLHVGACLAVAMFLRLPDVRLELLLLLSPLLYTLLTQLVVASEPRYLAVGAWVLVLPFSWWSCSWHDSRCIVRRPGFDVGSIT